jgi:UDP-N-acetyl-D-glucosamine/UDP-N-acetyl-D-galactosamine dehydrogenase
MTVQAALDEARIGIIGLDYVGLPLAVEFGKYFDTLGFDIDPQRITELNAGQNRTHEISAGLLTTAPSSTTSRVCSRKIR